MTVPECRTFAVDNLTGNAITIIEDEIDQYFAYSYWGNIYWGGLYFGVVGAILVTAPLERTMTITGNDRVHTVS